VRLPEDLDGLDGLVIPGGESTTMTLLMERRGLLEPVSRAVAGGLPTLGTCAGMILLASRVADARDGQEPLGVLDITVRRNAWGRQVDSFEAAVRVPALEAEFPGIFIRAPRLEDTGSAEVIARLEDGEPVGVKQGKVMALAFHPELSGDARLHREFLKLVKP
jgi:pyridoxal 5'-phosphate synthase pdxT subunit